MLPEIKLNSQSAVYDKCEQMFVWNQDLPLNVGFKWCTVFFHTLLNTIDEVNVI